MKIKTIDIYFFSGTGNTYLAAKKIAGTLENNNYAVNINNIAKSDPKKINLLNTIGIGFPIICWNTFPIVKKFINNLPNSNGTKMFIFTTMGDSSLNAAANFGNMLKNKGYYLIGTHDFLMPNNFIAVQGKEKNILKIENTYKEIKNYAENISNETVNSSKTNLFFKICFAISWFITERWYGNLFQKIIKFHIDKKKCLKCGLCIKICPVENITSENDYPVFNNKKCQVCMRCISYCSAQAIKFFLIKKTYKALSDEEIKSYMKQMY